MSATSHTPTDAPLLEARDLSVEFSSREGPLTVVQDLNLTVGVGQVHAVVGESGSGKSVTALAIMGLLPARVARVASGQVLFDGVDLVSLSPRHMRRRQGRDLAMVFQEPMTSLNPAYTIGDQIAEPMRHHLGLSRSATRARVVELLGEVGIPHPAKRVGSYPHEFSGGMRQRVMIAMALACEPKLLIADEPTTALDVTIQAQIVDLLRRLSRERGTAIMFITHDFGVVAEIADVVTVLYAGEVIESAGVFDLFGSPRHPYTEALLQAVPSLEVAADEDGHLLDGAPPLPGTILTGCRFAPRCVHALDECRVGQIDLTPVGSDRLVRCVRSEQLTLEGRE